jgi:hypothetical protein
MRCSIRPTKRVKKKTVPLYHNGFYVIDITLFYQMAAHFCSIFVPGWNKEKAKSMVCKL